MEWKLNVIAMLAGCLCVWSTVKTSQAQEIITLPTRSAVTQSYFLASLPKNPQSVAVLFPGGGGLIRLREENGQIRFGPDNFLVRSRSEFIQRGAVAAIIDAPSDFQSGSGMSDEFRLGDGHFTDISAAAGDLRKRFPELPIFLVGTSRGTISAAALGARLGSQVAGVILSATLFRQSNPRAKEFRPGLSRFDFGTIKVPLLFVHHVGDQCSETPYNDAARLSDKYPLISVAGGLPPKSTPCEAFSPHGFFGKEPETVEQMVNWMLKKPFQNEVK